MGLAFITQDFNFFNAYSCIVFSIMVYQRIVNIVPCAI